jgi:trans-aconitate 2-methyltransferase
MPTWNADQYLKFADQRTRPCRDLVAAISLSPVQRVIDLGCGPGNSTSVLAERWPDAEISGLDNSESMIRVAQKEQPKRTWIVSDIAQWAASNREQFDVVFSNAALHWVDNHQWLYPRLLERVRKGGVLAVQMPADLNALPHQLMRELAPQGVQVKAWHNHEPAFYYDVLASHAADVDVWETIYQQVMPNADAIVEWYRGSGMRPFLEACETDAMREQFLKDYTARIRVAFPAQPDGKVLFPFRRLFVIARAR